MKKESPILFSTEMVKAILEGRKSMTRRIVKMYAGDMHPARQNAQWLQEYKTCPFGGVGDLLWVREAWGIDEGNTPDKNVIVFKADNTCWVQWKPSIHMRKVDARIWLEITNVRVERLQDITDDDAIAEGIEDLGGDVEWAQWKDYMKEPRQFYNGPFNSFWSLWERINGKESWEENPWVWVIEFKVRSKDGYVPF